MELTTVSVEMKVVIEQMREQVQSVEQFRRTGCWRDRDALAAHFKAPHMAEWRAAQPALGLSERDIRVYETDEGVAV